MSDLVRHKKSAQVVRYQPVERLPAVIYGSRKEVMAEVRRRKGQVVSTGQLRLLTQGRRAGQYALAVEIQAGAVPSPWVKRRKVAAGVGIPLAVLFGLGWWAAYTLGALPLLALLGAILLAFSVLVASTHGRGGPAGGGGVEVNVQVRVR